MAQPLDPSQFEEITGKNPPSLGGSLDAARAPAALPTGNLPSNAQPPSVQAPDASTPAPNVQPQAQSAPTPTLDSSQFEQLPSYADGSSPLTPVNQSPITALDRAALAMGNTAGNIRYLKAKFQDVTKNKEGDLLVKDQGIWHRVDPTNLGEPDAWEATKKIIKGGALSDALYKAAANSGTALDIAGSVAGTAAGTALLPGAGSVAGSGAGAAAAEAIRTSLGRLAGTYYATPEQQVKDIGWEGLLGSGGETVALGVKPALPMLRKALGTIGDTATNFAKENLSSLWGTLTDAGRWATRRAMDDAGSVIGKANMAIDAIGPRAARAEAVDYATSRQNSLVNALADDSKAALQKNYGQSLLQLVKEVPDNFSANVGQMMKEVQQNMEAAGYGKIENGKFLATSLDDIADKMGVNSEQLPKIMGEKTQAAIQQIGRLTNQYGRLGTLSGKSGARQLVDLKKALSESFDDLYGDDVPQTIQRVATQIKDVMSEKIGQAFADHGAGDQYVKMNKQYSTYKDAVDMLNNAVDKGQTDAVVKHLVSKAGSYRTFKDEVASLATLMGDAGQRTMNDIADWQAAKGFVDFVPKMSGGNSAGTIFKTATTLTGQNNPKIVGKQIEYGTKALDFIKSLPPKQLKQMLGDDATFTNFITPLMQAYGGEDSAAQQLLQGAGVTGGQNGGQ